jgi:hypothetical protein
MNRHHYIMKDFIEEISSFILPQLRVIEMYGLSVGQGLAPNHQREVVNERNM